MVSAIGSFSASSAISTTVASTSATEAQLARDKKELSNCVNCESAKTKQGQADIQALTNKISIAEARLEENKNGHTRHQPTASVTQAVNNNPLVSNVGRLVDEFV